MKLIKALKHFNKALQLATMAGSVPRLLHQQCGPGQYYTLMNYNIMGFTTHKR